MKQLKKTPGFVGNDREKLLKRILESGTQTIDFLGHKILILPKVFPPTTASRLLAKHMYVKKGAKVLDIGTGTGVLALIAGLKGAAGYAIDINPFAVRNAQLNLKMHKITAIKAVESDLFSKIPEDERFDLMTFNRPFWDSYDGKKMGHVVERGFSDVTGNLLLRLLKAAKNHITPKGKILISVAEWEPIDKIEKRFIDFSYDYKLLDKQSSRRDKRRVYRAYELKLKT